MEPEQSRFINRYIADRRLVFLKRLVATPSLYFAHYHLYLSWQKKSGTI